VPKTECTADFIEWDVRNWSVALDFWLAHTTQNFSTCSALELGSRNGGLSLWMGYKGRASCPRTYVDDIARGILAALKPCGHTVFNLGSDRPAVLLDVVKIVERLIGRSARLEFKESHPADVRATWAEIARARQSLNWEPAVHLEEGVARLVQWYEQNRSYAREIDTT
jgi:nucleoside-diphosphate-sugar epimerase